MMRTAAILWGLALQGTSVGGVQGLVATAHAEASNAGLDMLKAGGTACDAAVAAAFALAVVEPYSSGIGGGGFALVRSHAKQSFLDFREVAPAKAHADMYMRDGKALGLLARDGALAVAVPGAVAGYVELHKRCGKLSLPKVMAPAVRLAKEGFLVDLRYNGLAHQRLSVLRQDPEASRIFLMQGHDGAWVAPTVGQRVVQPDLAKTLEGIAGDAGESFYRGDVAKRLAAGVRSRGGVLDPNDLRDYRVRERQPLVGIYRGQAIVTAPLPSAGGVALLTMLNIMETLPPETPWHDVTWLRTFIEGASHAYADRALLGDPNFVEHVGNLLPQLLLKKRAVELAKLGPKAAPADAVFPGQGTTYAQPPSALLTPDGGGHTTHLSVVDAAGDAVSMTTTVNFAWGSAMVAAGTGVLLNDEMDDFATAVGTANSYHLVGTAANQVAPGKVPLSSMTPTMVFAGPTPDSSLKMVVGSPGGSRIPTTVAQIIMHAIDRSIDPRWAVTMPRVHHQHLPDEVLMEPYALEPATQTALKALGYSLRQEDNHWCNATVVSLDPNNGLRTGAADPRGVGTAVAQ